MKTPCCEKTYCNDCITNALIESDFVCPACQTSGVLIDDLKPDEETERKVEAYQKEKESGLKAKSPTWSNKPSSEQAGPNSRPKTGSNTEPQGGQQEVSVATRRRLGPSRRQTPPCRKPEQLTAVQRQQNGARKRPAEEAAENPKVPKAPKAMQATNGVQDAQQQQQPQQQHQQHQHQHQQHQHQHQQHQQQHQHQQQQQQQMMQQMMLANSMGGMAMVPPYCTMPPMMNSYQPITMPNMNMNMGMMNPMVNPMMSMGPGFDMNGGGGNGGGWGGVGDMNNGGMPAMGGPGGGGDGGGMYPNMRGARMGNNYPGPQSHGDDEAYFRKPVNPHRHQNRQKRVRPSDYREL